MISKKCRIMPRVDKGVDGNKSPNALLQENKVVQPLRKCAVKWR